MGEYTSRNIIYRDAIILIRYISKTKTDHQKLFSQSDSTAKNTLIKNVKIYKSNMDIFFFFFFFLDLLKEVESSLRTNRDCLASLKCRTPCQNRHDYRLNHLPRKTRPKTT